MILNEKNGELVLKSVHFPISVSEMMRRIKEGHKCVDINESRIRFKRPETVKDQGDYSPPSEFVTESYEENVSMDIVSDTKQDDDGDLI